ncbi:hypothetical protein BH24ACT8_BH24ACT8_21770 [soil metagenome]
MWLAGQMVRLTRPVGVVAVAVLLCASCSEAREPAPVTTTDQAGNTVVVTPTPTGEVEGDGESATSPPTDPVATTLPVPTPDAAEVTEQPPQQAVLVRVGIDVPGGWTVQDMGETAVPAPEPGLIPPHQWCLVPSEPLPVVDGCAGVVVAVGGDWLPGAGGEPYVADQPGGWLSSTEPLLCPFDADAELYEEGEGNVVVTDSEGAPLTSTQTEVGGLEMRYETWRARCTEGEEAFTPRLWHVPELNVLVKDYFGLPGTITTLETLEGT